MSDLIHKAILITGAINERDPQNTQRSIRIVYQRVARGLGHRRYTSTRDIQRRRYVKTNNPKTPAQLASQARIRDAVASWHALSTSEKTAYRPRAQATRITPFNQHIKEWCAEHPLPSSPPQIPLQSLLELPHARINSKNSSPSEMPTGPARINLGKAAA